MTRCSSVTPQQGERSVDKDAILHNHVSYYFVIIDAQNNKILSWPPGSIT